MTDKKKKQQPPWQKPTGGTSVGLMVNNSMKLSNKEEFIPAEGKLVRWYTCGPTVYDSAHFGHARNYITFDILQRIMRDYFQYDIFYVMNTTDIDDKIILRSRRNYLYNEYVKSNPTITQKVLDDLKESWAEYIGGLEKKLAANLKKEEKGEGNKKELEAERGLLNERIKNAKVDQNHVSSAKIGDDALAFLKKAEDAIATVLDQREGMKMDSELVKKLCDQHSKHYENLFFQDLQKLGVRMPDVLVRVSEYVPQVIEMVQKIILNGFAYESEGSVYFDSIKFASDPRHHYGKLDPWSTEDLGKIAEGEGSLSAAGGRKADSDFALWKKSKPGEPTWDSPWGKGRPGWHIECSAMASDVIGGVMDVHCGGEDLKFPHHDNELAQSEAYYGHDQWVNYFLHSGHLHIDGLKMSKSLKNFITIESTLEQFSPREIRMLFLLKQWDRQMNYQRSNPMQEVNAKLKAFTEFLLKVNALKDERSSGVPVNESWSQKDKDLNAALMEAQQLVDKSLKDNFDTPAAIEALLDIVRKGNIYINGNDSKKYLLLSKIADYVSRIMSIFGIDLEESSTSNSSSSGSREDLVRPFAKTISDFRNKVRTGAKNKENPGYFLSLCDDIRDNVMPELGVKIVDDDEFGIYFVDKKILLAERDKAQLVKKEQQLSKKERDRKDREKKLATWEQARLSPQELVKKDYDVEMTSPEAIPAKTIKGKDVSAKQKKLIPQVWAKHVETAQKLAEELAKNPNLLTDLANEIAQLKREEADIAAEIARIKENQS